MDILLLSRGFFPFYRAVVQGLCDRGISVRMHCALTDNREKGQIADTPYILLPHVGGFRSEENIRLLIDYLRREQIDLVLNPNIQIFDLEKLIRQTREVLPGMRFIDLIHSCPDFIVRNKRTELREMTLRQVRTPKTAFQYLFPSLYLALLKQSVKRRAMKAYALFDKTVVLTPRYAEEYRKFYGLPEEEKKVTAIPNPKIVGQPHVPVTEKEKTILFVGRLSREKALYRLFAVWKQLYRELPDWQLTIVGDGAERERYEQTVRTEQLERVSFLGEQPAIPYIDPRVSHHPPVNILLKSIQRFMKIFEHQIVILIELQQVGNVQIHFSFQRRVGGQGQGFFRLMEAINGRVEPVLVAPLHPRPVPSRHAVIGQPDRAARQPHRQAKTCNE